jgi:adenosylhomocysteine nucleosidase
VRLAIFSAFPQELKYIVKNFTIMKKLKKYPFHIFLAKYSSSEIILVQTGIGTHNAENSLEYILEEYSPDCILSLGFGGALYDGAIVGDLIWVSKVLLIPESAVEKSQYLLEIPNSRETFSKLSDKIVMHEGCALTLEKWMKKSEVKKMIPRELSLPICDMETFFLAKLSVQKGLPFFAVRAITDLINEEIPRDLLRVSDKSGNYRFTRALFLLLCKPKLILSMIKLGRNSKVAAKNLWLVVKSLVEIL